MADLRDFNTSTPHEPDHASQNGMFLYGDKENNDVILQDAESEIPGGSAPMASGPLSNFHVAQEEESNAGGKILAGLVVALMLGAAGVYAYSAGGAMPKQQVASTDNGATGMAVKPMREVPTTPKQAANDITPTEMSAPTPPVAPAPISEPSPAPATRVHINSSASNTPRPRVARTHTAAAPAENASSVDARANATTQAVNQSMAENASRNSLPLNSTPDSMSTVQPTAPTTAPTLPSEQPTTPAPQPGEPAPANPVQ